MMARFKSQREMTLEQDKAEQAGFDELTFRQKFFPIKPQFINRELETVLDYSCDTQVTTRQNEYLDYQSFSDFYFERGQGNTSNLRAKVFSRHLLRDHGGRRQSIPASFAEEEGS